jgi:transcription elongation factor Elf1
MMAERENETEIKDDDIVFECPNCGHSLVINYKGAGLTVQCPECNHKVQVPIPEGIDVWDLDTDAGELEVKDKQKDYSQQKKNEEETENKSTEEVPPDEPSEGNRQDLKNTKYIKALHKKVKIVRKAVNEIEEILNEIQRQ